MRGECGLSRRTAQRDSAYISRIKESEGIHAERATPAHTGPPRSRLYFLAPILGEVFSFNTPPLAFVLDPSKFIFEPALYGSGALLIREVARRRGLGWSAILVMGAAYGILEEGVFIHSWFNPSFEGLHSLAVYGRAWDTSWVWAVRADRLPRRLQRHHPYPAGRGDVSARRGAALAQSLLAAGDRDAGSRSPSCSARSPMASSSRASKGYTHPPLTYLLAIALVIVLFAIGSLCVRVRNRASSSAPYLNSGRYASSVAA